MAAECAGTVLRVPGTRVASICFKRQLTPAAFRNESADCLVHRLSPERWLHTTPTTLLSLPKQTLLDGVSF